jgi:hypothetical protein
MKQEKLMRVFAVSLALGLAAITLVPGSGRGDDAAIREGTGLLAEGDRLADDGKFTEAVIRYKRDGEAAPEPAQNSFQARSQARCDQA